MTIQITHGEIITTLTIETDSEIELMKMVFEAEKACPYGSLDAEGNQTIGCSKYIDVDYTFDEATKTFTVTENFRYEEAAKAKEDIISEESGGSYSEDEYYSLEVFTSDLVGMGYIEVK